MDSQQKYPPNHFNTPNNDISSKQPPKVKGKVVHKPESTGKKLANAFFVSDLKEVIRYVIFDLMVPSAKETLLSGVRMMLMGEKTKSDKVTRDGNRSYISYDTYYSRGTATNVQPPRRHKLLEDIVFDERGEAEMVLQLMYDKLEAYENVTVNDYYRYSGTETLCDYTKEKYGWYDLERAQVVHIAAGYVIKLPTPVELV